MSRLEPDGSLAVPLGRPLDVVLVGNAVIDRLAECDLETVADCGLEPGTMTLVDPERARAIEHAYDAWQEVAGGSAANTAAGVASLGGRSCFVGTVGQDEAGRRYVDNLEASGVACAVHLSAEEQTGVCHVLVTPDGERAMATSLGAAGSLSKEAVSRARIEEASVLYLEGYLLDPEAAAAALSLSVSTAKENGALVALSLSDPLLVARHQEQITSLVEDGTVDLLFGNEEEALALTGAGDVREALSALRREGLLAVVTLAERGAVAQFRGRLLEAAAVPVEAVVDSTGAGDLFAAGVLASLTSGCALDEALFTGALAAAEVISHMGARPKRSLAELAAERQAWRVSPQASREPRGAFVRER